MDAMRPRDASAPLLPLDDPATTQHLVCVGDRTATDMERCREGPLRGEVVGDPAVTQRTVEFGSEGHV